MDYERIHKVQSGVISPRKLRMKLLGSHNCNKNEEKSTSSRASPSRLEEMNYAKSSLLACDPDEEVSSKDLKAASMVGSSAEEVSGHTQGNQNNSYDNDLITKEKANICHIKAGYNSKGVSNQVQHSSNMSTLHPTRLIEEDINGYESGHDNGSTCSFEFQRGDRTLQHPVVGPFSRHIPSKWNDAEKWIVSRQVTHLNTSKKTAAQNQGSCQMISNGLFVAPTSTIGDLKQHVNQAADTKKLDSTHNISQVVVGKFSFVPHCLSNSGSASKTSGKSDQSSVDDCGSTPRLLKQQNHKDSLSPEGVTTQTKVIPTIQSVSMRDVGTEMTPIASQEPSRTGTPIGATTPIRSPISSLPSTPKRGALAPSPITAMENEAGCQKKMIRTELPERELQLKTRKEIVALGIQLGKMNIASWASKDELEKDAPSPRTIDVDECVKIEYEARAAAWEEAEKSKHMARFKHEEVKIQAWETYQKAKFEAKMRKVEAQAEQMKAHAQKRMAERLGVTRQQTEEKQATARARMNRHAARTARQVEQIRQTGHTPSANLQCCGWFL